MEAHRPGHRLSYDRGSLIVVGPSAEHEHYKEFVFRLVLTLSEELGLALESRGATTFKNKLPGKGVEPDTCFYVQNASQVIGLRPARLRDNPPPDVVVEIGMGNDSLDKFHTYDAPGVPEIWRYDGETTHFYKLTGESYEVIQGSLAFPSLTPEDLTQHLELSKTEGQTAAAKAFRQTLRSRNPS